MKNLKNLLDGNKLKSDIHFKKLCINSNDIDPGDIFVALKNSSKKDGNKYIDHAFDNGAVAVLSGIHVTRVRIVLYALTGVLAALAGVILASRLMSGTPTAGNGIELQVLAAAVIGGASLRGGEGTILGAFLGVVFIALINNTMTMQAVSILLLLRIRINGFINPAIAFVLYIAISILIISPKPRLFDGINEGLTQLSGPESFSNWKVSPQTASAIRELQSESRSCPGDQLFQLAWMPIAYEITNRKNITGYDLPYHDTITLDEARNILLMLLSNPPGMLLVQERHANYQGPFPALGMKYLYENIS